MAQSNALATRVRERPVLSAVIAAVGLVVIVNVWPEEDGTPTYYETPADQRRQDFDSAGYSRGYGDCLAGVYDPPDSAVWISASTDDQAQAMIDFTFFAGGYNSGWANCDHPVDVREYPDPGP